MDKTGYRIIPNAKKETVRELLSKIRQGLKDLSKTDDISCLTLYRLQSVCEAWLRSNEPSEGAVCGDLLCGKCPNPACEGFNYGYHATPWERGKWFGKLKQREEFITELRAFLPNFEYD